MDKPMCKHCEQGKPIEELDNDCEARITEYHGLNDLTVTVNDIGYIFQIKNCPMCGRELNKED